MGDQVESGQVDEDETPPGSSVSPDEVTSKLSPDAEDAMFRRILASPEFEKAVQKHTNRENANARQRLDAVEEQTQTARNELLSRYDELLAEGMKPEAARTQLDIQEVLEIYRTSKGGEQVSVVADQQPDNVGALSGEDAELAASSLLDRMGATAECKNEVLEDVGRRVSFSNSASLDDTVYDLVSRWTNRQLKLSDTQQPVSESAGDAPPSSDKMAELQSAFEKEKQEIMDGGGGSKLMIDLRRKFRRDGLKI